MHVANPDWALEAVDRAAQADELEELVAQIKSTIESQYLTDAMTIKFIRQAIEEAGY